MKSISNINDRWKIRKIEQAIKLRKKNDRLRSVGKDPLKGWNTMVDTGLGGLNRNTVGTGSGAIDMTGNNNETFNVFSEEQKRIGRGIEKKNKKE